MINREVTWDASYGIIKLLMTGDIYHTKWLRPRTLIRSRVDERTKNVIADAVYSRILDDNS